MRAKQTTTATIRAAGPSLLYLSDYDPHLVQMLKSRIPAADRAWDQTAKGWQVAAAYFDTLQDISRQVLGYEARVVGTLPTGSPTRNLRVFLVEYIGMVKQRPDGSRTATGFCDGAWRVFFPEDVLLQWFGMIQPPPAQNSTYYQVMGVKPKAAPEEIKKAWRRLALQWHPDRCKEPDAAEQFMIIKGAWEVLGSEDMRRRYDAGLALEASLANAADPNIAVAISTGFRPPLRCGWILAEAVENLPGRYAVSGIIAWEDVVDSEGKVMVSSWPAGADTFTVDWVQP